MSSSNIYTDRRIFNSQWRDIESIFHIRKQDCAKLHKNKRKQKKDAGVQENCNKTEVVDEVTAL